MLTSLPFRASLAARSLSFITSMTISAMRSGPSAKRTLFPSLNKSGVSPVRVVTTSLHQGKLPAQASAAEAKGALLSEIKQAEDGDALMPAFTHFRPAQPILVAHYFLAHAAPLRRDRKCTRTYNILRRIK